MLSLLRRVRDARSHSLGLSLLLKKKKKIKRVSSHRWCSAFLKSHTNEGHVGKAHARMSCGTRHLLEHPVPWRLGEASCLSAGSWHRLWVLRACPAVLMMGETSEPPHSRRVSMDVLWRMALSVLLPLGRMGVKGAYILSTPRVCGFLLTQASSDHIADNVLRQPQTVAFIVSYGIVVPVPKGLGSWGPRRGHFAVATLAHLSLGHLHGHRSCCWPQHPHSPAVSLLARSSGREG